MVVFRNDGDDPIDRIFTGGKLIIDFHFETKRMIKNPIFGISFYNVNGLFTGFWNSYENVKLPDITGKGIVRVTADHFDLPIDCYRCSVIVSEEEESNVIDWLDLEQKLTVDRPNNTRGLIKLPQKWEVIPK